MAITKAELQEKYDALTIERDALLKAQAEFIQDVLDIAGFGAREFELCTELEGCMELLGIDIPDTVVTVERAEVSTYRIPGFQAQRVGILDHKDDSAALSRIIEDCHSYGMEYGDMSDYLVETGESGEIVRASVLSAA